MTVPFMGVCLLLFMVSAFPIFGISRVVADISLGQPASLAVTP